MSSLHYKQGASAQQSSSTPHRQGISNHDNNHSNMQTYSIDLVLSLEEEMFMCELKNLYHMLRNSHPVTAKYANFLLSRPNSYETVLRLLYNCPDFFNIKAKSFPMFLIEEFQKMAGSLPKSQHLTTQLKVDAFKIIMKQNVLAVTNLVIEVFELTDTRESVDIFLAIITFVLDKKMYKEGCQYASMLQLHSRFSIHDFLVPLIIQDKLHPVDDFLRGSVQHQRELVQWLDGVLSSDSIREHLLAYIEKYKITGAKSEKLQGKSWKRLIVRLVKMFKLPSDLTPNLNKRRHEGALWFLIHKRFVENGFGAESWREMIQEAVGDDTDLQKELVTSVAQYGEFAEALRWAYFYNIDRNEWPYNVRVHEEETKTDPSASVWDSGPPPDKSTTEYHQYPLGLETVVFVNDEASFRQSLIKRIQEQHVDVVGIDCEWKPSFGGSMNELALMQIATRSGVAVVDVITLAGHFPHLWKELSNCLFNNGDILKLGFGLSSDLSMIRHALPELNLKQSAFLDLCSLWKQVEKNREVRLPYHNAKSGTGPSLSSLVHRCLGRPLDKSEQFSNWEKRPLRDGQVYYAALDAYCLIQVYDILKSCFEAANCRFDDLCYDLIRHEINSPKKKSKKASSKTQRRRKIAEATKEPVQANQLKIACDGSLQTLAQNLRRCGIDTVVVHQFDLANITGRHVLASKTSHVTTPTYRVTADCPADQLREVLDHFSVVLNGDDSVVGRCPSCNDENLSHLSKDIVKTLAARPSISSSSSNRRLYLEADDDEEATGFTSDEDDDYCEAGYSSSSSKPPPAGGYPGNHVVTTIDRTRSGTLIKTDNLSPAVVEAHDRFYVCEGCGEVALYEDASIETVIRDRLRRKVH